MGRSYAGMDYETVVRLFADHSVDAGFGGGKRLFSEYVSKVIAVADGISG